MSYTKSEIRKAFLNKSERLNSIILKHEGGIQYKNIYEWAVSQKEFTTNVSEKIYCLLNDIDAPKRCPICDVPLKFWMFKYGYHNTCNKSTCIRAYKPKWGSCSETKKKNNIKHKQKFFNDYFNIKETLLVDNNVVLDYIQKRIIETNSGENGKWTTGYNQSNKHTLFQILKLTEHIIPVDIGDIKWAERFYVLQYNIAKKPKCIICNKETPFINFKQGYQTTCSVKCSNKGYAGVKRLNNHLRNITSKINKQYEIIFDVDYDGLNRSELYIKCKKCEKSFYKDCSSGRWKKIKCPYCESGTSQDEKDIIQFLKNIGITNILANKRDIIPPLELDIFLPDKNIAIEYNGNYWHTENNGKDKTYHLLKTEMCKKNGIDLIQIFSDEWICDKNNIVRKLKSLLNNIDRKYIIKEIDSKIKNKFLVSLSFNTKKSDISYGLFYKTNLVGIVGFKKSKEGWRINEIYNTYNCNLKEVIKSFIKDKSPKELIIHIDKTWMPDVKIYEDLNFKLIKNVTPKPFYFYKHNYIDRKNRPSKDVTYQKIWNCGEYVYRWSNPEC